MAVRRRTMESMGLSKPSIDLSFWRSKHVLITGHTGFKGSWLTKWLLEIGASVSGYALAPKTDRDLFNQLEISALNSHLIGDIRDYISIKKAVEDANPDVIFHLAAQSIVSQSYSDPLETWTTNVNGSLQLLEVIRNRKSKRPLVVIFITTDKVYENRDSGIPFAESDPLGGKDPYSASKAAAELLVKSWHRSFLSQNDAIRIASARSGNVIGGGDWAPNRLLPDLARALESNTPLTIRNPQSTRPWQHVLDPLHGYLMLAERLYKSSTHSGSSWNFGPNSNTELSVSDVINIAKEQIAFDVNLIDEPSMLEATRLTLNSQKASLKLGWSTKWDAERAIFHTLDWYKRYLSGEDATKLCVEQIDAFTK